MAVNDANCLVMSKQFSWLENDCITFLQLVKAVKLSTGGSSETIFIEILPVERGPLYDN